MKKKITKFITTTRTRTTSIDIIPTDVSPLVSNSPMMFKNSFYRSSSEDVSESENSENIDTGSDEEPNPIDKIVYRKTATLHKLPEEESSEEDSKITLKLKLERIIPSGIVATGTALAMMPIFNNLVKNSEDFGIDIHSNRGLFIASTANTFIVASLSSFSSMYHFIEKYQTQASSTVINPTAKDLSIIFSKIGASCSIILPLGLLWTVELQNQKVVDSQGFDKFIAWATFTTIPLIIDRVVESVKAIDNIYDNTANSDLSTTGSKLVVYGLASLSIVGRTIAYTEVAKAMAIAIGINETAALGVGIAVGGLLGSGGVTIFEYQAIKSLFEEQQQSWNVKKLITGTVAVVEGAWFTLPIVALGLSATEGWNSLLKGALFTPLFVSHSIFEATKLYDNMMMSYDTISEEVNYLLGDYYNYDNLEEMG